MTRGRGGSPQGAWALGQASAPLFRLLGPQGAPGLRQHPSPVSEQGKQGGRESLCHSGLRRWAAGTPPRLRPRAAASAQDASQEGKGLLPAGRWAQHWGGRVRMDGGDGCQWGGVRGSAARRILVSLAQTRCDATAPRPARTSWLGVLRGPSSDHDCVRARETPPRDMGGSWQKHLSPPAPFWGSGSHRPAGQRDSGGWRGQSTAEGDELGLVAHEVTS